MLSSNKENKALYEARLKYLGDELSWIQGEKKRARKKDWRREDKREEGKEEGRKKI